MITVKSASRDQLSISLFNFDMVLQFLLLYCRLCTVQTDIKEKKRCHRFILSGDLQTSYKLSRLKASLRLCKITNTTTNKYLTIIARVRVRYKLATIISYPSSASGPIILLLKTPTKQRKFFPTLFVKTSDFQLVFNFEQTRTVTLFGEHGIMAHIMMAKPIRALLFHYRMIQFLIKQCIQRLLFFFGGTLNSNLYSQFYNCTYKSPI